MGDTIFQIIVFSLLLLGGISFILFLRRMLFNLTTSKQKSIEIEKKLDRIIELLEKNEAK
ncbi:DUF4083 domain-containing protein [Bacillus sp. JJ722]|uniref:DUF4083 domain-containing protein n=1 Tax=Bacillus sp. JJ722 TaxID=3122973 RepID=UPI002FFDF774